MYLAQQVPENETHFPFENHKVSVLTVKRAVTPHPFAQVTESKQSTSQTEFQIAPDLSLLPTSPANIVSHKNETFQHHHHHEDDCRAPHTRFPSRHQSQVRHWPQKRPNGSYLPQWKQSQQPKSDHHERNLARNLHIRHTDDQIPTRLAEPDDTGPHFHDHAESHIRPHTIGHGDRDRDILLRIRRYHGIYSTSTEATSNNIETC